MVVMLQIRGGQVKVRQGLEVQQEWDWDRRRLQSNGPAGWDFVSGCRHVVSRWVDVVRMPALKVECDGRNGAEEFKS